MADVNNLDGIIDEDAVQQIIQLGGFHNEFIEWSKIGKIDEFSESIVGECVQFTSMLQSNQKERFIDVLDFAGEVPRRVGNAAADGRQDQENARPGFLVCSRELSNLVPRDLQRHIRLEGTDQIAILGMQRVKDLLSFFLELVRLFAIA